VLVRIAEESRDSTDWVMLKIGPTCWVARNAYGESPFGSDDADDRFGKPDNQLFQLTVLVF
jgi:hypothetical protein